VFALFFKANSHRYALDANLVAEVVPRIKLDPLPGMPDYFVGVFQHRGALTPVLDMNMLMGGTRCADAYATRIIVVNYPAYNGHSRLLGLLAENVTVADHLDDKQISSTGVVNEQAPYLESAHASTDGILPIIEAMDILPPHVRESLFTRLDELKP